ncbi:hypothetical protein [Paraburkholderia silvatlantica]|uniref:Uncharacterized protein n=1 Tax=Paraburkholderia silvatlantica TaxID=321895 RepID=A0ABR6FMV3_9BURK|nr:hypothetical protein [Paraburkholderia silvatlantica]MBB2928378.1 hypothetical protein [Paraburkholderia silvatlantica]PVY34577.1 hypothetical protein C7411_107113 [Paraburkholderia silvatlantica]PXW38792.1 hypothetical protein C7413_107113 [Paraburkholderia silvatlantica]
MNNVTDINAEGRELSVREQAELEVRQENARKGKDALKVKLRALAAAENVVANLKREIDDLEASIADGSF